MKRNDTNTVLMVATLAISLFSATLLLSFQYANAQNQTTKGKNVTAPIGNVRQLSKALGNNTKILANNTKIGAAPNFTKPKVTAGTPITGPTSPTKGKSPTNSTSGGGKTNRSSISSGPGKV